MFAFDVTDIGDREIFTSQDLHEFRNFILTQCTITPTDLNWLTSVIFEWNEEAEYNGYWRIDLVVSSNGIITDIRAIIVLNTFYLRTLNRLQRTFSHEYGHHWTLAYFLKSRNIQNLDEVRLPDEYYEKRGLNYDQYSSDDSNDWGFRDKEVIAEDYRVLFTPYKDGHRMVGKRTPNQLLKASPQVADVVWNIAKPSGWM